MPNRHVYLHEIYSIKPGETKKFFAAVEKRFLPLAKRHGLGLVGVWESSFAQGEPPEAVAVWELEGWSAYASLNEAQYPTKGRGDRALQKWNDDLWAWVAKRQGKILVPGSESPTLAELGRSKSSRCVCVHETMTVVPNQQDAYLDALQLQYVKLAREKIHRDLVGIYRTFWRNTENINIWSLPGGWETLAVHDDPKIDAFAQRELRNWMITGLSVRTDWFDRLLYAAPFCR